MKKQSAASVKDRQMNHSRSEKLFCSEKNTCSGLSLRTGDAEKLAMRFLESRKNGRFRFRIKKLESTVIPAEQNILAIHYADAGAQGYAGDVRILYDAGWDVRIMSGNYAYGDLNLEDLVHRLPLLSFFTETGYSRDRGYRDFPEVPSGWIYLYMGAMNHLIIRNTIWESIKDFLDFMMHNGGHNYQLFDAVSWFCNVKEE